MEEILLFLRRLKNDIVNKIDGLDAEIGETADVGGTQSTGTVNAKLNGIMQKQKVIRGLVIFQSGTTMGIFDETIQLPTTINPEYANVSVGLTSTRTLTNRMTVTVANVTNTTIEIKFNTGTTSSSGNVYVGWQVVGGLD